MDKPAADAARGRRRPRVLPRPARRGRGQVVPRRQALQAAQAVAVVSARRGCRCRPACDAAPSSRSTTSACASPASRRSTASPSRSAQRELFADHRPQRRRQDLDLQRALRRLPAAAGRGRASSATTSSARSRTGIARAGHGAHVPEHRAVREPHRARQPDARPPHRTCATARSPRCAWLGRARREELAAPRGRRGDRRLPRDRAVPQAARSACCPTASRSASSSAARWRWSRSCCCSTSRWPGMNLEETEDMARFILDIRDELGIPMILVEHDMGLVMDLADRVLVLDFGAADRHRHARARSSATPTSSAPTWARSTPTAERRRPEATRDRDAEPRRRDHHASPRGSATGRSARPTRVAMREKDFGIWQEITWARLLGAPSQIVAHGLLALGVEPGDRVAIHSENRREWLFADLGDRRRPRRSRRPLPDQPGRRGAATCSPTPARRC